MAYVYDGPYFIRFINGQGTCSPQRKFGLIYEAREEILRSNLRAAIFNTRYELVLSYENGEFVRP